MADADKIIIAELPQIPGVLVVYRKPSERSANPERLNLDRRDLAHIPLLEGEEQLRLLNLQHNRITKIENLVSLPNLIFLDLYNNEIKEISHLHIVPTLRVLMLGKNNIERIRNLQSLTKLDVLDLHSNKISKIENLSYLSGLRVLNLANNKITSVDNLSGLTSLNELNLRRNEIEVVSSLGSCPKLQRLFLSSNRVSKFESIASLNEAPQLTELALDDNPIATTIAYYKFCFKVCPNLRSLDLKKVTSELKLAVEEERIEIMPSRNAAEASKDSQGLKQNTSESAELKTEVAFDGKQLVSSEGKEEAKAGEQAGEMEITQEKLLDVIAQEWRLEVERVKGRLAAGRKKDAKESMVQSGHAEIEEDTVLSIYGNALEVLQKEEFQKSVEQISFQYMLFDTIAEASVLNKLKKFQKLSRLNFSHNLLSSFLQISKLECLPHITSLTIDHNDLAKTVLFKSFIVYRFTEITSINGENVSEIDRQLCRKQFQKFDKALYTQLPLKVSVEVIVEAVPSG
eukprot:TRINITY_DN2160_c0_g1_i19.p1 TRINITY_DN2160_c0_g1~~TRINITY_DN2160_c0_g1_i19.p1  ORF type:complete len:515 (+),score=140.64 TRINITY_DN2160_c0_g1_i19:473-2017(+)